MGVHKYLDVHVSHVTKPEMDQLETTAAYYADPENARHAVRGHIPIAVNHRFGYWLHVSDPDPEQQQLLQQELPNVARIVAYARAHRCRWVKLDADGDQDLDLPAFEW